MIYLFLIDIIDSMLVGSSIESKTPRGFDSLTSVSDSDNLEIEEPYTPR